MALYIGVYTNPNGHTLYRNLSTGQWLTKYEYVQAVSKPSTITEHYEYCTAAPVACPTLPATLGTLFK